MRPFIAPVLLFTAAMITGACGSVPIDDQRSDNRLFPTRGVIQGTVSYTGPHPCSQNGHIVGNAILLVFDAKNPPPPVGLANTALNFVAVSGDTLFANEPRETSSDLYCPKDHGVTDTLFASAPFDLSPLDGGEYLIQSFYDMSGHFLPTFHFRNLPQEGDIGGGYLDAIDASKHLGDPNYQPIFKPIDVGVAVPGSAVPPSQIPTFTIPPQGFVADNVTVTLGAPFTLPRPYFYPDKADQPDPMNAPVLVMTQDHHVLANPANPGATSTAAFQASFASLRLNAGVAPNELALATDPTQPFHLQIAAPPAGGLNVWTGGPSIPETLSSANKLPMLWPLIVFAKLADDPNPQGLTVQGSDDLPAVIIQGITLDDDNVFSTVLQPPPTTPGKTTAKDHLTVLVRPSVVCFDPRKIDQGGLLVTPYLTGNSADPTEKPLQKPLFVNSDILAANKLVREIRQGCLPTGTYGINAVYPQGQAWTTPNEIGSCADGEGDLVNPAVNPGSCATKPRPVLLSQGYRAVLQIVPPTTPEGMQLCATDAPVPPECLHN